MYYYHHDSVHPMVCMMFNYLSNQHVDRFGEFVISIIMIPNKKKKVERLSEINIDVHCNM